MRRLSFPPLAVPLLFVSDAPESFSGLGRIGRDLASLAATLPQFRVGYLGKQTIGKRKFPWMQYTFPEHGLWGEDYLRYVWDDFSGGEPGVIFTIWDASRLDWFAANDGWVGEGRSFYKWGYFPVDSVGPSGTQPAHIERTYLGYDRTLAASEWGKHAAGLDDWIPHGYHLLDFHANGDSHLCRKVIGWKESDVYVGMVATNQSRKDWPVAFECAAHLRSRYGDSFHFWIHTDMLVNYWDLTRLAADYGVLVELTTELNDWQLAQRYSACDCTILPSGGEGFGYPILESIACGTPCAVTDYAAGPELNPGACVPPVAYRIDTIHNVKRAVLDGRLFADAAQELIEKKRSEPGYPAELAARVEHLQWKKLDCVWKKWFLRGLA